MANLKNRLTTEEIQELQQLGKDINAIDAKMNGMLEKGDYDFDELIESNDTIFEKIIRVMEICYGDSISEKTIGNHLRHIESYLSYMITHEGMPLAMAILPGAISGYFGDWYISHNLSSSPSSTKAACTALKKMADALEAAEVYDEKMVRDLKDVIKEEQPEWLLRMTMFNDPDCDYDDYSERVHGFRLEDFF